MCHVGGNSRAVDGGGNCVSSIYILPREGTCLPYSFFASCSWFLLCKHGAGPAHPGVVKDMYTSFVASDAACASSHGLALCMYTFYSHSTHGLAN